ncbi:MAG: hypothetical protein QG635_845 [Bacteroidota bacterium]|nr:hypothetical protein [Bacteroidota bacterium]
MKKFKTILLGAALIIIYGCSDNGGTTSPTASGSNPYFPLNNGSYWIYSVSDPDSVSNPDYKPTIDSTWVKGPINKLGRDGKILATHSVPPQGNPSESEAYFATEGKKIFIHSDYFMGMLSGMEDYLPVKISEQWMKVADSEDDLWRILELEIPDTTFPLMPMIRIKGDLMVFGSMENPESVTVMGTQYQAQKYTIKIDFTGSLQVPGYGSLPIQFTRKIYLYFVENIGLVKRITDKTSIPVPLIGDISFPESDEVLIRYSVK